MNVESVVDDVKARLARVRGERPSEVGLDEAAVRFRHPEPVGLDLRDLDAIAQRHHTEGYRVGKGEGLREGRAVGEATGRATAHGEDMQTLAAVADVLRERLERIPDRLMGPDTGRDRRTKDELRQEAIDLVDDIRACFGVLLAGIVQGAFDEGS